MSDHPPVPLTPIPVGLDSPEFVEILGWFDGDNYIGRMLRADIPQRVWLRAGRIWIYRDPAARIVGFGTLDVCAEYSDFTEGQPHVYIPLLAVNPTITSLGYGTSIVRHLIGEAATLAGGFAGCQEALFLDVYESNEKAIKLYEKCGFIEVSDRPRPDPDENDWPYIIMMFRLVPVAPV
jgi:ribosomal protein S18 acetylase RimI-like enzyme